LENKLYGGYGSDDSIASGLYYYIDNTERLYPYIANYNEDGFVENRKDIKQLI
jgi:hypothetical protein